MPAAADSFRDDNGGDGEDCDRDGFGEFEWMVIGGVVGVGVAVVLCEC